MPTDPTPLDADTAMLRALEWAEGKRSWNNLGHDLFDLSMEGKALREQTIAVMDTQEVVKWCAVAQALAPEAQGRWLLWMVEGLAAADAVDQLRDRGRVVPIIEQAVYNASLRPGGSTLVLAEAVFDALNGP